MTNTGSGTSRSKLQWSVRRLRERERFLSLVLHGLNELSLMQRLRRTAQSLYAALPLQYREAVGVLRLLAPRMQSKFATLALPDFVGLYGLDDFDSSTEALRFFTDFGSSEFAVRCFLRKDLYRALAIMQSWSLDGDAHVRRLASEVSSAPALAVPAGGPHARPVLERTDIAQPDGRPQRLRAQVGGQPPQ